MCMHVLALNPDSVMHIVKRVDNMEEGLLMHIPYCLAVTPCSLLRLPPYFRAKLLYRVILPPLHAPPAGRSNRFVVLQFLHVYACCKCRRVVFVYQACRK